MSSGTMIPNFKPLVVEHAIQREVSMPVGHYLHPDDPSGRTALCGAPILGVPTFGEFRLCERCQIYREIDASAPLTH